MWLISYRYIARHKYEGKHNVKSNAPVDTVEVIDVTPEQFLFDAIRKGQRISEMEGRDPHDYRFDKIEVIYFAREIGAQIGRQLQDNI